MIFVVVNLGNINSPIVLKLNPDSATGSKTSMETRRASVVKKVPVLKTIIQPKVSFTLWRITRRKMVV